MVAQFVLASLKPCDVPTTVRLGFSPAADVLSAILNILQLKSTHLSMFLSDDDKAIELS